MVAVNAAAFCLPPRPDGQREPDPSGSNGLPRSRAEGADGAGRRGPAVGKVTLTGASDGSLLRLTHGELPPTASRPGASRWRPGRPSRGASRRGSTIPGLSQTLAAGSDDDGWWIVGADAQCDVTAWRSDGYGGTTWEQGEVPEDTWYLDPERTDRSTRRASPHPARRLPGDRGAHRRHRRGRGVQRPTRPAHHAGRRRGQRAAAQRARRPRAATRRQGGRPLRRRQLRGRRAPARRGARPGALDCFGNDKARLGIAWAGDEPVAQVGFEPASTTTASSGSSALSRHAGAGVSDQPGSRLVRCRVAGRGHLAEQAEVPLPPLRSSGERPPARLCLGLRRRGWLAAAGCCQ